MGHYGSYGCGRGCSRRPGRPDPMRPGSVTALRTSRCPIGALRRVGSEKADPCLLVHDTDVLGPGVDRATPLAHLFLRVRRAEHLPADLQGTGRRISRLQHRLERLGARPDRVHSLDASTALTPPPDEGLHWDLSRPLSASCLWRNEAPERRIRPRSRLDRSNPTSSRLWRRRVRRFREGG